MRRQCYEFYAVMSQIYRLVRPDFRNESLLTDTTKHDDTRKPKELSSTTVSGLAPLKDQGFYLPSTECRIAHKNPLRLTFIEWSAQDFELPVRT